MTGLGRGFRLLLVGASLSLLWACATPERQALAPGESVWEGRLALLVNGNPPQSLSAGFELRGSARRGELTLNSPLGQALAVADWNEHGARLRQGGNEQRYASVDDMTTALTGTPLPLAALFDWLQGRAQTPEGWEVDLSGHADGRLLARRLQPLPSAELRLRFSAP